MKSTLQEFETQLLAAIAALEPDAYGLAVHEHLEASVGHSIAIGQIYTSLARLEQRGLVCGAEGGTSTGRGGRPRKFYRLERSAVAVLRASGETYKRLAALIDESLASLETGR